MYWLILFSQKENGREISANDVSEIHPADFLIHLINKYPNCDNKLLFAVEISKQQFDTLNELI